MSAWTLTYLEAYSLIELSAWTLIYLEGWLQKLILYTILGNDKDSCVERVESPYCTTWLYPYSNLFLFSWKNLFSFFFFFFLCRTKHQSLVFLNKATNYSSLEEYAFSPDALMAKDLWQRVTIKWCCPIFRLI